VEVGHVDGEEENSAPANLFWTCRRCNVRSANALQRAGVGPRTNQFNPPASGAKSLGEWLNAVLSMKGESDAMSVSDAVDLIHSTPSDRRSQFAEEIWARRRKHFGSSGHSDGVPF
jgi:hypothetical protein